MAKSFEKHINGELEERGRRREDQISTFPQEELQEKRKGGLEKFQPMAGTVARRREEKMRGRREGEMGFIRD